MKKGIMKKICMAALAIMTAAALSACSGQPTNAGSSTVEETTTAAPALTEEEYIAKTEELQTTITESMTKVQEDLANLDTEDVDGAKKLIEEMQAPFVEFAAVLAPEKFAPAQEKYKSGCEAMVEYLNICLEMMDMGAAGTEPDEADLQALTERLTTSITTVQTDLTEAMTLMADAGAAE